MSDELIVDQSHADRIANLEKEIKSARRIDKLGSTTIVFGLYWFVFLFTAAMVPMAEKGLAAIQFPGFYGLTLVGVVFLVLGFCVHRFFAEQCRKLQKEYDECRILEQLRNREQIDGKCRSSKQ